MRGICELWEELSDFFDPVGSTSPESCLLILEVDSIVIDITDDSICPVGKSYIVFLQETESILEVCECIRDVASESDLIIEYRYIVRISEIDRIHHDASEVFFVESDVLFFLLRIIRTRILDIRTTVTCLCLLYILGWFIEVKCIDHIGRPSAVCMIHEGDLIVIIWSKNDRNIRVYSPDTRSEFFVEFSDIRTGIWFWWMRL